MSPVRFLLILCLVFPYTAQLYAQESNVHIQTYLDSAQQLLSIGEYHSCIRIASNVMKRITSVADTNDPYFADAGYFLGISLVSAGQRKDGIAVLHRVVNLREKLCSVEHPVTGDAYYAIASAYTGFDNQTGRSFAYKSLQNAQRQYGEMPHADIGRAYAVLGQQYMQEGKYDSVLTHLTKAISTCSQARDVNYELLGSAMVTLGWYYENHGELSRARNTFLKAEAAYKRQLPEDHPLHANISVALGNLLTYEDKHAEAITLIDKALAIRLKKLGPRHSSTIYCYILLGIANESMGKYDEAIRHNKTCIALDDELYGPGNRWSANIYNNLGMCYAAIGKTDSAIYCYQKSMNDNLRALGGDNFNLVFPLGNLADLYIEQKQPVRAKGYLEECLRICRKNYGEHYRSTIETLIALANLHLHSGNIPDGLTYADAAIVAARYQSNADVPFSQVQYAGLLQTAFVCKARILYYKALNEQDVEVLRNSWDIIQVAEDLTDHTRKTYSETVSRQLLATRSLPMIEQGIRIALALYDKTNERRYKEAAFLLADKHKALTIRESIANQNAQQFAGVPPILIDSLYTLQSSMNSLEEKLITLSDDSADDEIFMRSVRGQIADLKTTYYELLDHIEQTYPDYYALKYQIAPASIVSLQSFLGKENSSLISYFLGDSTLSVFVITCDTLSSAIVPVQHLDSLVLQYCTMLRNRSQPVENIGNVSYALYNLLLEPYQELLHKRLMIIPDGVLGFLPFETLYTSSYSGPFHQAPWLLKDHACAYALNADHVYADRVLEVNRSGLVAFAPEYKASDNGFSTLFYNEDECKGITTVYGGKTLSGTHASIAQFEHYAAQADILHLATHARVNTKDGNQSFLVFTQDTPEFLYVRDIYNMRIPAEMAVLSACETSSGELRKGEGIISLSHAFAYAGTKSMVTSLWSVNDQATSTLMTEFYRRLRKGLSKDIALQQSKLYYLSQSQDPQQVNPFFWAPCIAIGDMRVITPGGKHTAKYLITSASLLSILGVYYFYKKRRKRGIALLQQGTGI